MEEKQEMEWMEAQKIAISEDLVSVAKQQLQFLAAVDRHRSLYEGPVLEKAIHRYKTCWLPLLAKHTVSGDPVTPLVVPLDCEWIWHCHRLNPVQYRKDCEEFYGRILDNRNVESTLKGKLEHQTEGIWSKLYPAEPFELDYANSGCDTDRISPMHPGAVKAITYDLVSAVKRQSSFCYQVSRPSMVDNRFLQDAVARYKGFLHLIKRNREASTNRFCVPTYDVDLMWHSHQLQPISYCKDMMELFGKVLEHDDTDSDRSKGKKLDVGFSETTEQWEETYGLRYWRAGAMYRGNVPSSLMLTAHTYNCDVKNEIIFSKSRSFIQLPKTMVVEVLLEIVGVKNLAESQKGNMYVTFSKKQPDIFFSGHCRLSISSESGKKLVAGFECEPTGELVLALVCNSDSNASISKPGKTVGTASISLEYLMDPNSKLSIERWIELRPFPENVDCNPVCLRIAASFTVPVPAPLVATMAKTHPISMSTCLFPLPGMFHQIRSWTRFLDDSDNEIISLQMRTLNATKRKNNSASERVVVGVTRSSRKPCLLAEFAENRWSLKDSNFFFHIGKKNSQECHIFELIGDRQLKIFSGRKLDYEPRNFNDQMETGSLTVVEFSAEYPYGKAVALLDMKSGVIKVNEEWFALPGILLAFIISNMLKKEGYEALVFSGGNVKDFSSLDKGTDKQNPKGIPESCYALGVQATETEKQMEMVKNAMCDAGCDGNCRIAVKSGGCGSGCGGGCGSGCGMSAKSSGCGSSCGGDCGSGSGMAVKSSGCGTGCGSGCGMTLKSRLRSGCGDCGAGCGGGCGDGMTGVKSSGCGAGCGGCGADARNIGAVTASSEVSPIGA